MLGPATPNRQSRLVLCPYGIPPARRALCTALLHHCGGDVSRMIDAPAGEQPFLAHLKRLTAMLDAVRAPIVFLSSFSPLRTRVIGLRERYELELPSLRGADWIVFVEDSPTLLVREALQLGRLEHRSGATVFHAPAQGRYLIVSPEDVEPALLEAGMAALTAPERSLSQSLPRQDPNKR